jgi:hypothetical protein
MYTRQMNAVKCFEASNHMATTWSMLCLKLHTKTGKIEPSLGTDVVCECIPPDIKIEDEECVYYLLHFASITEAYDYMKTLKSV